MTHGEHECPSSGGKTAIAPPNRMALPDRVRAHERDALADAGRSVTAHQAED
eukprot:gene8186-6872_t